MLVFSLALLSFCLRSTSFILFLTNVYSRVVLQSLARHLGTCFPCKRILAPAFTMHKLTDFRWLFPLNLRQYFLLNQCYARGYLPLFLVIVALILIWFLIMLQVLSWHGLRDLEVAGDVLFCTSLLTPLLFAGGSRDRICVGSFCWR